MTTYTHKHHIVPKHMGGDDSPENLIELTIDQHVEAHWMLWCMHGCWEDEVAYRSLEGQMNGYDIQQEVRRNAQYERWTTEERTRQSEKMRGEDNPQYGKPTSAKQKAAVSAANSVPKPHLRKLYKERYTRGEHIVPVMVGSENPKARKVRVGEKVYDTVNDAAAGEGVSRVTIRYRILSKTNRFDHYYYA